MKKIEIVKNTNKIMLLAMQNYEDSTNTTLWHCYTSFSELKQIAYEECQALVQEYDGTGLRILTYNANVFTCGFYGTYNGEKAFFQITPKHTRVCIL